MIVEIAIPQSIVFETEITKKMFILTIIQCSQWIVLFFLLHVANNYIKSLVGVTVFFFPVSS